VNAYLPKPSLILLDEGASSTRNRDRLTRPLLPGHQGSSSCQPRGQLLARCHPQGLAAWLPPPQGKEAAPPAAQVRLRVGQAMTAITAASSRATNDTTFPPAGFFNEVLNKYPQRGRHDPFPRLGNGGDGGGVQDGAHAAAESVRDALAEGRGADDPDVAVNPSEQCVAGFLPAHLGGPV
jgi:hypothetical protein